MKIKFSLLFVSALLLNTVFAQTDALLWRISGKDLTKPSYVFGTVHAHCSAVDFVKPELINAMNGCDLVLMELDLNDFATMVAMTKSAMKPSLKPLSVYMSAEEISAVDKAMQTYLNDSFKHLENLAPMTLMAKLMFSEKFIGCSPLPIDMVVAQIARELKKETKGFETYAFQDSLLSSIPENIQAKWLSDMCLDPTKYKQDLEALFGAYNAQSAARLYEEALKSPEMAVVKDGLLDMRNRNWITYMKQQMGTLPLFVAVGAAHLGGDAGLLILLKNEGYTLTPVQIKL